MTTKASNEWNILLNFSFKLYMYITMNILGKYLTIENQRLKYLL